MLERLPEHIRTRAGAEAITAPSAILLAGAGASVAILAGAPVAAAAVVGALAWAARVATRLPRRPRQERIDPFTLGEPWRQLVMGALSARDRFERTVANTDPGPLRDRLSEVAERVRVGVRECWKVAQRGEALDNAVDALNITAVERQLAQVTRELRSSERRSDIEATAAALQRQLESAQRLKGVAVDARDRLRRLEAQLDEAVARAIELSLSAPDVRAFQPLGSDVESVVSELESLRSALEETGRASTA